MIKLLYFLSFIPAILSLTSCKPFKIDNNIIDNKSYINEFDLLQENPKNSTSIRIQSPQAIIDPSNNDIEILDSNILIFNKDESNLLVESGKSRLNNTDNIIHVFNNVFISLIDLKDSFIKTDSFKWDLNKSNIDLDSPLDINFNNTQIFSNRGLYNIKLGIFKLDNVVFYRNIFDNKGHTRYQIKISSDYGKWFKEDKRIEFISVKRQVESVINFLSNK